MSDEVRVIPMQPQHIEELVDVYLQAFHDRPSGKMGRGYVREFLRWFMAYEDGIALVAVEGNTPLGFGVGAVMGYQKPMNRKLFWTVFWSLLLRPWLWLNRDVLTNLSTRLSVFLGRRRKISPQVKAKVTYPQPCVSYVGAGVSDKARGKRVGKKIYTAFTEACEQSGRYRAVRGTVHESNEPVNRILRGLGWKEIAEKGDGYMEWAKIFD